MPRLSRDLIPALLRRARIPALLGRWCWPGAGLLAATLAVAACAAALSQAGWPLLGAASDAPEAEMSFEQPAYVNMPVWVHVTLADGPELSTAQANMRYPFSGEPWDFGSHHFEVKRGGKLLARISSLPSHPSASRRWSAAPSTSPKHRFPLHLHYRFDRPGTYFVRYNYGESDPYHTDVTTTSAWTRLRIKRFSEAQRRDWLRQQEANPPEDVGELVGDYLPSLLAVPDDAVLSIMLRCVHHPNDLVQHFAVYSLDYFSDESIRREIPRLIRRKGATDFLAYYISWRREILRPVAEEIVEAVVPFLQSDSPSQVGGALQTLYFMHSDHWQAPPDLRRRMEAAVWDAVEHVLTFDEIEALQPLSLFMGGIKSDRSRQVLWRLTETAAGAQALTCLTWIGDRRDLPRLGQMLLSDDPAAGAVPYHLRRAWGKDAIPYLLKGIEKSPRHVTRLACAREVARESHPKAFEFFKDVIEQDLLYKRDVLDILHDRHGLEWGASDEAALEFLKAILRDLAAGGKAPEKPPAPQPVAPTTAGSPMAAARNYFKHLREAETEKARALAVFEDEKAEKEWEKQVGDYAKRLKAGGTTWWGDTFCVQRIPGPPPGEWALAEVQWRYLAGLGWMMGSHYTYRMRTVDDKWKMLIDNATTEKGIPWLPADKP